MAEINLEKRDAFREAIGRGEQIFGGIILAQKCKTFEQSEYNLFESKAKAIVNLIKKSVGQEKVNVMVQRAQVGAMTKPYSDCGNETEVFVRASKKFVDKTYSILSAE